MATLKPAYLIHGDDHGRIAERRMRLRQLAERQSGAAGLELLEGEAGTPDAVAAALSAMTFSLGRRFVIVDGVERWKERELEELERALDPVPPDTTVVFFAREDSKTKVPARLQRAVEKAGGEVSAEQSVKPWELPKWVMTRAREHDLVLEPDAARILVAQVGERQQRLLRELEKLALSVDPGTRLGSAEVEALTASSAQRRLWSLADALVGGDLETAVRLLLALRAQGERVTGLLYWMGQRLRLALEVAEKIDAGAPQAQVRRELRMPSKAAEKLIAEARATGKERLREAVAQMADLELASRGGGLRGVGEDTEALLAIRSIAA